MRLVLLSGGSGQRLWPLSNNGRSKQFLKLLTNEQTGQLESMFQRTCNKIKNAGLLNNVYISTNISQIDIMTNQMDTEIPLIIEPERRDTYPAIALASAYLYTEEKVDEDEVVIVCPIDSYAEDKFYEQLIDLEKVLKETKAEIGLLGVKPTYPSSKYGYIIPQFANSTESSYLKVDKFKEKPDEQTAKELLKNNAIWNCGIFAFRLGYIIDLLEKSSFESDYYKLLDQYYLLSKNSFDYEVVEKAQDVFVIEYQGDWKDLGTWNTLTDEMDNYVVGNSVLSTDSENTHIINELDIPIRGLGLKDIVIAASPDGILVSNKMESHRLKELTGIENERPMFEERRWGWYKVLDFLKKDNDEKVLTKRLFLLEGKNLSYQYHLKRSEVWTVISGAAEFILNGERRIVLSGDVLKIEVGDKHSLRAITDTEIIEVQMGSELIEEDIIRLEMEWSEIY